MLRAHSRLALCAIGAVVAFASAYSLTTVPFRLTPADVLIFAPHPDDEVIGTAGVIQQALRNGLRVRVVFATNGDGYPQAAAARFDKPIEALDPNDYLHLSATRQREAIAADGRLGLDASSLVFLGYPDGVLAGVYADAGGTPFRSPSTGLTSTYGLAQADYHTAAHGHPAPYTRAAALADVEAILKDSMPAMVYMTDRADMHPDHRATYDLVHDAIAATGLAVQLRTFVVHGGLNQQWPWPVGATPGSPYESHTHGDVTYPEGVSWPPPVRVPLTAAQSSAKLDALEAHGSQWAIDREYLGSFVKSEEIFWTGH